jgi:hypothetical protein
VVGLPVVLDGLAGGLVVEPPKKSNPSKESAGFACFGGSAGAFGGGAVATFMGGPVLGLAGGSSAKRSTFGWVLSAGAAPDVARADEACTFWLAERPNFAFS